MRYCTESDVRKEAPHGLFANPAREIASVSTTGNRFELDGHGYQAGQAVRFRSNQSLPSPIAEGVDYYVTAPDEFSFCVSATVGGAAVDLTTAGESVMVITCLPFNEWIEWASAFVDSFLPAHVLPLVEPFPSVVVDVTARLAAARGLVFVGGTTQDISALQKDSQVLLDKWAKRQPIRGVNAPRSTLLAVVSSVAGVDPRGWYPPGGGL